MTDAPQIQPKRPGQTVATSSQPKFRHVDLLTADERAAWSGLVRAYASLVRQLDDEFRRAHGLPLSWFEVLAQLFLADGHRLRMAELADRLVLTRSGVTRLVDRLERGGFVERCGAEHDGRGTYTVLTERGFDLFEEGTSTHVEGLRRLFFDKLSGDELTQLNRIWERLDQHSCREREQRLRSVARHG
jgi:DNA-binding MarR family transcriptional regulator